MSFIEFVNDHFRLDCGFLIDCRVTRNFIIHFWGTKREKYIYKKKLLYQQISYFIVTKILK